MGDTQGVIRGVSGSLEIPHVLCIYLYIIASILRLVRDISGFHSAYEFLPKLPMVVKAETEINENNFSLVVVDHP